MLRKHWALVALVTCAGAGMVLATLHLADVMNGIAGRVAHLGAAWLGYGALIAVIIRLHRRVGRLERVEATAEGCERKLCQYDHVLTAIGEAPSRGAADFPPFLQPVRDHADAG